MYIYTYICTYIHTCIYIVPGGEGHMDLKREGKREGKRDGSETGGRTEDITTETEDTTLQPPASARAPLFSHDPRVKRVFRGACSRWDQPRGFRQKGLQTHIAEDRC